MNKEEIGITASKKDDFSEWYTQVVLKAELADYAPVKGLIVLRPSGYSIWESLKVSLDKKLALQGVSNGFLPILIPESLLGKEKKHFAGFDPEVFWVTHSGKDELGDRLALRPTSETLAYTMYAKWIKSWRDLPLRINFWNTALRAEIKATKPFLRTSEFLWQEGHTVHADSDEAKNETKVIMGIYKETVENELAIPVILLVKIQTCAKMVSLPLSLRAMQYSKNLCEAVNLSSSLSIWHTLYKLVSLKLAVMQVCHQAHLCQNV